MNIKKFKANNFRNLEDIELNLSENINIIYGDNAQGKTNIIEAIWLFSGIKSFRNSKDIEMVNFNHNNYNIEISFKDFERENNSKIIFFNKKQVFFNGIKQKSIKELFSKFYCILFAPNHMSLFKDGPKERRKFIDISISKIKSRYYHYINEYEKILNQRNHLIKNNYLKSNINNEIDIWDIQLSKIGTIITLNRLEYIEKILPICEKIHFDFSSQKEIFNLKYNSSIFENEIGEYNKQNVEIFYNRLKSNFKNDIKFGYTTIGVHKDDIDIYINDLKIKTYGSQGQQRSSLITLKLSEASIIKLVTNESPIILLDDVMSELDSNRQKYILNHLKNSQVIISCCDIINALRLHNGKIFNINSGKLISEKNI